MFEIRDIDVFIVKGVISASGKQSGDGYKQIQSGSFLTDGEKVYEVTGLPLVNYKTADAMLRNIVVTIKSGDYDPMSLNGKTLSLISH